MFGLETEIRITPWTWNDNCWADSPQFGRDPALVFWACLRACCQPPHRPMPQTMASCDAASPGDVEFVDEWVVDQKCPDRDIATANF